MNAKQRLREREIRRDILCLRAASYRQAIRMATLELSTPLTVVGTAAQWYIKNHGLAYLLQRLRSAESTSSLWRFLVGGGLLLLRLWRKNRSVTQ